MFWIRRHSEVFILGLIVLVAAGARLWKLGTIPYGYAYDEAGIMYDAWSISLWHRDQFAHFMPLSFQSFGDYKPPLLIYVLACLYAVFGFHEIIIRLVAALAGVGSVVVVFLLAQTVFAHRSNKTTIGLIAAGVIAFSPWSIHLSRVGFEQNLTFFLGLVGLWLFIQGFTSVRSRWLSSLFLAASCYTFHTAKIFIPLALVWTWFWMYKKKYSIKSWVSPLLLTLCLLLPLGYSSFFQQGNERSKTLILYTDSGVQADIGTVFSQLTANVARQLSPSFWTRGWDGVSIRHTVPGYGVLTWPVYCLLLISVGWLLCCERNKTTGWLIGLLFIGLAPAVLSRQSPHVIRSQFALIATALLIAAGSISVTTALRHRIPYRLLWLFMSGFGITILVVTYQYLQVYFGSYAIQSATNYQYGYREAISYIKSIARADDRIYVTRSYEQPYIYLLLYNQIHPQAFLFGALNQYQIQDIVWPDSRPHAIFLATPHEIPYTDSHVIKTIYVPHTNQPALVIARNE